MMTTTVVDLVHEVEQFLYREARLLDVLELDAWLDLFAPDGVYWVPIHEDSPTRDRHVSLVHDDALAREERVYHLLHVPFPAQRPRSRTVHVVSNVEIMDQHGDRLDVSSTQVVYELRGGDFRQVGLGERRTLPGRVEHQLVRGDDSRLLIQQKKVVLLDRDAAQGNLTFLL